MKRVFLVEWGTESSMGTLDDPAQWEFDDLNEAIAYYDEIDLRYDWVREYNTSHGASRHSVMAKQIIDCWDFGDTPNTSRFCDSTSTENPSTERKRRIRKPTKRVFKLNRKSHLCGVCETSFRRWFDACEKRF